MTLLGRRLKNINFTFYILVDYTLPLVLIIPLLFLFCVFLFLSLQEVLFLPVSTFEKAVLHFLCPQQAIIARLTWFAENGSSY
jgi:hypothetical protein